MAQRTQWALTTTTFPELEEERQIADRVRADRPDLASMSAARWCARALAHAVRAALWRSETIGSNQAAVGPAVISQLLGDVDPSLIVR